MALVPGLIVALRDTPRPLDRRNHRWHVLRARPVRPAKFSDAVLAHATTNAWIAALSGVGEVVIVELKSFSASNKPPASQVRSPRLSVARRPLHHLTPIGESRANAGTLTGLTEPPDGGTLPVEVDRRRGRAMGRIPSTLSTICPLEAPGRSHADIGRIFWVRRRGRPGRRRPTRSSGRRRTWPGPRWRHPRGLRPCRWGSFPRAGSSPRPGGA